MGWTEERVLLLRLRWTEGFSCSQIAKELGGVTRNAVIGKVHRLGLAERAVTSRPKLRKPRAYRPPLSRRALRDMKRVASEIAANKRQAIAQLEPLTDANGARFSILTVEKEHCRYGVGDPLHADFAFCGRPREGEHPYCKDHCRLCYQPQSKRVRNINPDVRMRHALSVRGS